MKINGRKYRLTKMPIWRIWQLLCAAIKGKVSFVSKLSDFPFIHGGVIIQNTHAVIEIGNFSEIHERVVLSAISRDPEERKARLKIGKYTTIWYGTVISAKNSIEIGDSCAISWNCTIIDDDMHQITYTEPSKRIRGDFVKIGNKVWIGASCIILKGVTIEDNVIVAAGSVVRDDIPANSIVAGNPARVVSQFVKWE